MSNIYSIAVYKTQEGSRASFLVLPKNMEGAGIISR
jgi:hypothetical protein